MWDLQTHCINLLGGLLADEVQAAGALVTSSPQCPATLLHHLHPSVQPESVPTDSDSAVARARS